MGQYFIVFKKYAQFSGRSSRKEFWLFLLCHIILVFCFSFIDGYIGTFNFNKEYGLFSSIYILVAFIPTLAVMTRRLHDVGKSGTWIVCGIIPIVSFYLIYLLAKFGEEWINQYGINPLYEQSTTKNASFSPHSTKGLTENPDVLEKSSTIAKTHLKPRFCRRCGEHLPDEDSLFCRICGTKVEIVYSSSSDVNKEVNHDLS